MAKRELLSYLKSQLAFLESGGYERNPDAPWQATLVFEDSPDCLRFDPNAADPCRECPLMKFVPESRQNDEIPCRFIPLNSDNETLDFLYRKKTKEETLAIVHDWLKRTIAELEVRTKAS